MSEKIPQELQTNNTLKVINLLRKYDGRLVLIKDMVEAPHYFPEIPASYLGAVNIEDSNYITVYINFRHPIEVCEAVFVHEILHVILRREGFPRVTINENVAGALPYEYGGALQKLLSHFSSIIEHPEVFRRMNLDFELKLNQYFEIQVQQKLKRLHSSKTQKSDPRYHFERQ